MKAATKFITLLMTSALLAGVAQAQLTIEITEGVDNPTKIAVVPFAWNGVAGLSEDVSSIVSADLRRSGQFVALGKGDMLGLPSEQSQVFYRDWRVLEQEYLVVGKISPGQHND